MSGTSANPEPMNDRMVLYVIHYLAFLDGTKAAEKAGYKNPGEMSKQLQRHPLVRAAIVEGLQEREQEIKDQAIKALEHTMAQATADIRDLFDAEGRLLQPRKMPKRTRRAIHSFEVVTRDDECTVTKVKLHDKRASQELILKFAGKLREQIDMKVSSLEEAVLEAERIRREREAKET